MSEELFVYVSEDELNEIARLRKRLRFATSVRLSMTLASVMSLLQVPLIYSFAVTHGGKNLWVHPTLVGVLIALAIWGWVSVKYYKEKAQSLCRTIEGRPGVPLPRN